MSFPWTLVASAILGLLGLAFPRGPVRERYGEWQRFVR